MSSVVDYSCKSLELGFNDSVCASVALLARLSCRYCGSLKSFLHTVMKIELINLSGLTVVSLLIYCRLDGAQI